MVVGNTNETIREERGLRLTEIDCKIFLPIDNFWISLLQVIINLKIDFCQPKVSSFVNLSSRTITNNEIRYYIAMHTTKILDTYRAKSEQSIFSLWSLVLNANFKIQKKPNPELNIQKQKFKILNRKFPRMQAHTNFEFTGSYSSTFFLNFSYSVHMRVMKKYSTKPQGFAAFLN